MVYTGKQDLRKLKQELLIFVRNANILTLVQRGATNTTETFNGTGLQFNFDVANGTTIKNVREVQVNAVVQTFGIDYTVDYEDANPGRVNFIVAPPVGVNNVSIEYEYGTDSIYSDFPRTDLSLKSYPRIGLKVYRSSTESFGIGGTAEIGSWFVRVGVWDEDMRMVDDYLTLIRNAFMTGNKSFYYFQFIDPQETDELRVVGKRHDEIVAKSLLLKIPLQVEII